MVAVGGGPVVGLFGVGVVGDAAADGAFDEVAGGTGVWLVGPVPELGGGLSDDEDVVGGIGEEQVPGWAPTMTSCRRRMTMRPR